jgi:hypothetical protein
MAGVSLVGYSGSLIKDAVHSTLRLLGTEESEPEVTRVLVGQIPYYYLGQFILIIFRRLLHSLRPGIVSISSSITSATKNNCRLVRQHSLLSKRRLWPVTPWHLWLLWATRVYSVPSPSSCAYPFWLCRQSLLARLSLTFLGVGTNW